jgi:peptide/nickel transport system substrate-binding protein
MSSVSRRRFLQGSVAAAGTLLTACGPISQPGSQALARKRLTLSWWTDTGYPSPFTFSNLGPGGIVKESMLFDSLLWKDRNGLIPWLARSWETGDGGRTVNFRLNDASWHDGKPFGAEDVAFTFSYLQRHPFAWADTSLVESATVIDSRTVSIRLKQPFAPFLHDVAGVLPMLPKHIWSSVSDPLKFTGPQATVGTGPYIFGQYVEGEGAYLFKGYDRFFRARPAFQELAYSMVPENQQPVALANGQIDSAMSTHYDVQAQFQSGRYRVLKTPPFSIVRLVFNTNRAPLNQPAFRQAVAHAIDRTQLAQRVIHGDVIVGNDGVIPPGSPWHNPRVSQHSYDPARARTLLDSIGFDRSTSIQLLADSGAPDAELVQSMLAQVGVKVVVVSADPKTRTDRLKSLDYQVGLLKHIGVGGDPDFLRRWYSGRAFNAFELGNVINRPDFLQLAAQQAQEVDSTRRHALVDRMQAILAEDLPTLPLYHQRFYLIFRPAAWDRWFNTWSGIMSGIPLSDNKLALLLS